MCDAWHKVAHRKMETTHGVAVFAGGAMDKFERLEDDAC